MMELTDAIINTCIHVRLLINRGGKSQSTSMGLGGSRKYPAVLAIILPGTRGSNFRGR